MFGSWTHCPMNRLMSLYTIGACYLYNEFGHFLSLILYFPFHKRRWGRRKNSLHASTMLMGCPASKFLLVINSFLFVTNYPVCSTERSMHQNNISNTLWGSEVLSILNKRLQLLLLGKKKKRRREDNINIVLFSIYQNGTISTNSQFKQLGFTAGPCFSLVAPHLKHYSIYHQAYCVNSSHTKSPFILAASLFSPNLCSSFLFGKPYCLVSKTLVLRFPLDCIFNLHQKQSIQHAFLRCLLVVIIIIAERRVN